MENRIQKVWMELQGFKWSPQFSGKHLLPSSPFKRRQKL